MALNRRNLTLGMVTFVDLLGFSDRVRAMTTVTDLEAIERDVSRVQTWFDHRSGEESVRTSHRLRRKQVLAFSDCLVSSVSSFSQMSRLQGDFDVLMGEIFIMALAQARCATSGIFLRGASDYGIWFKRKDTMISPAMVGAYELEGAACVPMIAISDTLRELLENHADRQAYSEDADPFPKSIRRYEHLPNGQAHWFIDYMPLWLEALDGFIADEDKAEYQAAGQARRDEMRSEAYWRDVRQMVEMHRDAIRSAHAAAAVPSVRAKYVWLAGYHDDALARFWNAPPTDLLIGTLAA